MPYPRGANGRARVNARSPVAFAICDRCGFRYNHDELVWQYEWAGNALQNQRILVCTRTCNDLPNEQLRVFVLPADPVPIINPRPDLSNQQSGLLNLGNRAGTLFLLQVAGSGYPISNVFVAPGGIWWNGTNETINVVPGGAVTPGTPPMIFGRVTYLDLLNAGGANLSTTLPTVSGYLWNDNDVVKVA